jgi:tetratricopeptide (TPR) repeat protein
MRRSFAPVAVTVLTALLTASPAAVAAQSAARHLAEGDKAYSSRRAPEALRHYRAAIAGDSTRADALWRASAVEAEIAEFDPDSAHADSLLASAERHGRAAVTLAPKSADAHFALAQALGRTALRVPTTSRLPYAIGIHKEALACLELAPGDARCLHVLGLWDAEYMRLGHFSREMANTMTGGKLFANATWEEAERNLKAAIAAEPKRAIHHLDLARIYRDQGKKAEAKAEFQAVIDAPLKDYNDERYREVAKNGMKGG